MKAVIRILLIACVLFAQSAFAIDLASAKAQGWIGEQRDGYLGLVKNDAPAEVKKLLADVNQQRQGHFAQIAAKNNIAANEAAKIFAREAAERTLPGNYLQGPNGWVRK